MASGEGREHVKTGTLAATASARAMPITPLARTRLVFLWADVAIEQELLARQGRAEVVRSHGAASRPTR
jgi:hypothetical protein